MFMSLGVLPTKMLHSIKDFETNMYGVGQEFIAGLYDAAARPSKQTHTFNSKEEALRAIQTGRVNLDDEIIILE